MYISARKNNELENHSLNAAIPKATAETSKGDSPFATAATKEQHNGSSSISFPSNAIPADGAHEKSYMPAPNPAEFMAVNRSEPLAPDVLEWSRPEAVSAVAKNYPMPQAVQLPSVAVALKEIFNGQETRSKRVATQSETLRVFKKPALASEGNIPQSHGKSPTEAPQYSSFEFIEYVPVTKPKSLAQPPRSRPSTSSILETAPKVIEMEGWAKGKSKCLSVQEEQWLLFHLRAKFPDGKIKDWTAIADEFNRMFGRCLSGLSVNERPRYFGPIACHVSDVTPAYPQVDPAPDIVPIPKTRVARLSKARAAPRHCFTAAEDDWIYSWISSRDSQPNVNRNWQLCAEEHRKVFPLRPRSRNSLMGRYYELSRIRKLSRDLPSTKEKVTDNVKGGNGFNSQVWTRYSNAQMEWLMEFVEEMKKGRPVDWHIVSIHFEKVWGVQKRAMALMSKWNHLNKRARKNLQIAS
ncbi:hypothetical protein RUND412_006325 [Rhizina undulata]